MEYRAGNRALESRSEVGALKQEMIPFESKTSVNGKTNAVKLICICISIVLMASCSSSQSNELGTYEDPEVALKETQKALNLLSSNLNKGYQSVNGLNEYEITKNKIFKVK